MAHNKPSVAVIGCGYWGKNLVRKFAELEVLVAVADASPAVASGMSAQYGVPARPVDDILGDSSIDAVAIAAPAELHHDLAVAAFAAGKHVFVEKPIALTMDDARAMQEAAQRAGRTLMVGHLLQYHPAFLKLKEIVREGALGRLRYIYSRRLNLGKVRTREDVLWSFAPHDISMILALAGEAPDMVFARGAQFLTPGLSDFAIAHLGFANGIRAHVEASWLNPTKEQRLVVVGEDAMVEFNDRADWGQKLTLYRHRAEIADGEPVVEAAAAEPLELEPVEPLLNECRHFLDFIRSGEPPYTDGVEAMAVLGVLQAASESMLR